MTTSAERLADAIFDLVDKSHPRGLIRSELVDLITRHYGHEPLENQKELTHAEKVRRAKEKAYDDFIDKVINPPAFLPPTLPERAGFYVEPERTNYIATTSAEPYTPTVWQGQLYSLLDRWIDDNVDDETIEGLTKPDKGV